MQDADLYKGISPEKQPEYEKWLIDRYGGDMPERIETSRKSWNQLTEPEQQALLHDGTCFDCGTKAAAGRALTQWRRANGRCAGLR